MRVRGRRVILLIAGALPLLAEDDRTTTTTATGEQQHDAATMLQEVKEELQQQQQVSLVEKEETFPLHPSSSSSSSSSSSDTPTAAAKLPTLLPLNLLQVESTTTEDLLFQQQQQGYNARSRTTSLQQLSSLIIDAIGGSGSSTSNDDSNDDDEDDEEEDDDWNGTEKEPPDASNSNSDHQAIITDDGEITREEKSKTNDGHEGTLSSTNSDTAAAAATTINNNNTNKNTTTNNNDQDEATTTQEQQQQAQDEKEGESKVNKTQTLLDTNSTEGGEQVAVTQEDEEEAHGTTSSQQQQQQLEEKGEEPSTAATTTNESVDGNASITHGNATTGQEFEETTKPDDADDNNNNSQKNITEEEEGSPQLDQKQALLDLDEDDDDDEEEDASISDRVAVDYASKSAGALVLEKSPHFKGTSNLLNGDRDKYAISPCNEKKFVILSLSEDIYVKQVKLANYELYSSRVKDIQIQISQTMGNWVDLGIYTATPDSGIQAIDLREPAWGRYLKFKFLSHYGEEFYCTLSQIMVHGSTMVQGFHEHMQEETNNEEEEAEPIINTTASVDADAESDTDGVASSAATTSTKDDDGGTVETTSDSTDTSSDNPSDEQQGRVNEGKKKENETAASAHTPVEQEEGPPSQEGDTPSELGEDVDENATGSICSMKSKASIGDGMCSDGSSASDDDSAVDDNDDNENDCMNNDLSRYRSLYMGSRKDRNASAALPSASIGLSSSNVFSTIVGRIKPLHLKGIEKLKSPFPNSNHLTGMLSKATDSTKAIRNALKDPAILEHLQHWSDSNREHGDKFPAKETFGLSSIGPREQTLVEKLAAYIQQNDNNRIKRISSGDGSASESDTPPTEENKRAKELVSGVDSKQANQAAATNESPDKEKQSADDPKFEGAESFEELHDTDLALVALLENLPSIKCLKSLDFDAFKAKAAASRKGSHGQSGHAAAGHAAEPIFKMLTDQIKTLQANLAVHDQFTKEAFQCYQRVLLDVVVELQSMRLNHETRLLQLEQDMQETKTVRWIFVIYQLMRGLPNWVSLTLATFVTSYISPLVIAKPLALVENYLNTQLSQDEHAILGWMLTACLIILSVVATVSLCWRFLSSVKDSQKRPSCVSNNEEARPTESTEPTVSTGEMKQQQPPTSDEDGPPNAETDAPATIPKDTTCVDCNLAVTDKAAIDPKDTSSVDCDLAVADDGEGNPCKPTPRALDRKTAAPCHKQLEVDANNSSETSLDFPRDTTENGSGMRTPDPDSSGDYTPGPESSDDETPDPASSGEEACTVVKSQRDDDA